MKEAYRAFARRAHPDGVTEPTADSDDAFSRAASAWAILADADRRATYDATGWAGIAALDSIAARAAQARALGLASAGGEAADLLADAGDLDAALLEPAALRADRPAGSADDDACPRSVPEALWNIEFHDDESVRYYGLWWVYRFKVTEAEPALVRILLGGGSRPLRRRAALALGAVAQAPVGGDGAGAAGALAEALADGDYYLRYRAAEALANIARRHADADGCRFPPAAMQAIRRVLETGRARLAREREARSGFSAQEGMFDLEKLEPEVREKLAKVFEARRENEKRARRTTMTPQLGVDAVDADVDEPFEWVLKAAGAIGALGVQDDAERRRLVDVVGFYAEHDVPLVRYAAHKAMYALTGEEEHARVLVGALGYGIEHHYSQRVLIRDLGDIGYAAGARAVAESPMVENSFKVLALKNMLGKHDNDASRKEVRDVLKHMDSLL